MPARTLTLPAPPRAEILSVTELVADVRAGKIRIPEFQRLWKWKPEQVRRLFDSLYRGFPIGSLLMWRRPRPAERLEIGGLTILAGERHDAWAVIDGQQRLWSLVGTLAHLGSDAGQDDPFDVSFDPEADAFRGGAEVSGEASVPLRVLWDGPALQDWAFTHSALRERPELRQKAFEAGHRIASYRVPVYVVETDDPEIPRQIYQRVNRGGTPMEEADVFNALVGTVRTRPGRLEDLQAEAQALGMGELRRHKLLQCVMALRGLDVTRRLEDQGEIRRLEGALEEAAPALRQALVFLRNEARIPHLRLLPYPVPLIVLTRLFHLWREPQARTRLLLKRWVWRGLLSGAHEHGDRTRLRAAVQAVEGDEEAATQRLLALVPVERPEAWWLDARFDGRSAASRITGLGLAALGPRHLQSGEVLEIAGLIDAQEAAAFRRLAEPPADPDAAATLFLGAANRFLHPPGVRRDRIVDLARAGEAEGERVLRSHAFDERSIPALAGGDWATVLVARRERLAAVVRGLGDRLAEWGQTDRPSLDYLLRDDDVEAA